MADPLVPDDSADVYSMAWMIGYLGDVPDELRSAFPDVWDWGQAPSFLSPSLAVQWKRGYESGLSFYTDHADTRRGRK